MLRQTHAEVVHAHIVSAGRGSGVMLSEPGMGFYACVGIGTALSKHISSSGRMLVSKGGVSFPAPDSKLRHTRGDSWEEGVALNPWVH